MMSGNIFNQTSRFCRAVDIINGVDEGKFPKLLTRVAQNVHEKHSRTFTDQEEAKLSSALGIPATNLKLLLEAVEFIFQQAAYYIMKPPVLQKHLSSCNVSADKVAIICEVWSRHAKSIVEKLKKHSFAPLQLDSVEWDFNLQLAEASRSRMKDTNAVFQLNLSGGGGCDKPLLLSFNHQQLLDFHEKLETIQTQLDSLT